MVGSRGARISAAAASSDAKGRLPSAAGRGSGSNTLHSRPRSRAQIPRAGRKTERSGSWQVSQRPGRLPFHQLQRDASSRVQN